MNEMIFLLKNIMDNYIDEESSLNSEDYREQAILSTFDVCVKIVFTIFANILVLILILSVLTLMIFCIYIIIESFSVSEKDCLENDKTPIFKDKYDKEHCEKYDYKDQGYAAIAALILICAGILFGLWVFCFTTKCCAYCWCGLCV